MKKEVTRAQIPLLPTLDHLRLMEITLSCYQNYQL